MRSNRTKLLVPIALSAALAATLAGCSTSNQSAAYYGSENGFGAGDRFGSYLFDSPTRQNIAAANQHTQPVDHDASHDTATANVGEQNLDD